MIGWIYKFIIYEFICGWSLLIFFCFFGVNEVFEFLILVKVNENCLRNDVLFFM